MYANLWSVLEWIASGMATEFIGVVLPILAVVDLAIVPLFSKPPSYNEVQGMLLIASVAAIIGDYVQSFRERNRVSQAMSEFAGELLQSMSEFG